MTATPHVDDSPLNEPERRAAQIAAAIDAQEDDAATCAAADWCTCDHHPHDELAAAAAHRDLLAWLMELRERALDNNWWSIDVNEPLRALARACGLQRGPDGKTLSNDS